VSDKPPAHEHNENGQVVYSRNTVKNTVIESAVFYCTCGHATRTETVTSPVDTGGDG
jgi:hypothetical protein